MRLVLYYIENLTSRKMKQIVDFLKTITLSEMKSDTTSFNYIEKMISRKIKSILTRFNFN